MFEIFKDKIFVSASKTMKSTKILGYTLCISLSTIVLNSRDWSEIIWLPRNLHFKINLPIGLYPKKPAGMHWLGRNDAVPYVVKRSKTRIFHPTAKF